MRSALLSNACIGMAHKAQAMIMLRGGGETEAACLQHRTAMDATAWHTGSGL